VAGVGEGELGSGSNAYLASKGIGGDNLRSSRGKFI